MRKKNEKRLNLIESHKHLKTFKQENSTLATTKREQTEEIQNNDNNIKQIFFCKHCRKIPNIKVISNGEIKIICTCNKLDKIIKISDFLAHIPKSLIFPQCEKCKDKDSCCFCANCRHSENWLCKNCIQQHDSWSTLKIHTRTFHGIELSACEDINCKFLNNCTYYCLDCKIHICQECLNSYHSEHSFEDISNVFSDKNYNILNKRLKQMIAKIEKYKSNGSNLIKQIKDNLALEEKNFKNKIKKFEDYYNVYHNLFSTYDTIKPHNNYFARNNLQQNLKMFEEIEKNIQNNIIHSLVENLGKIFDKTQIESFNFDKQCISTNYQPKVEGNNNINLFKRIGLRHSLLFKDERWDTCHNKRDLSASSRHNKFYQPQEISLGPNCSLMSGILISNNKLQKLIDRQRDSNLNISNKYSFHQISNVELTFMVKEEQEVRILGENFSELNQLNCNIYINEQKYEFSKTISLKPGEYKIELVLLTGLSKMEAMFENCSCLYKFKTDSNFIENSITTTKKLFYNCENLVQVDTEFLNTKKTTDMSFMFFNCKNLICIYFDQFQTDSVVSMEAMFYNCVNIKEMNLSEWNTESLKIANKMFHACNMKKITLFERDFEFLEKIGIYK